MDLVPDRVVPQRIVEGEPDVVGECLVRVVPPSGEVLLDGAEIHGVPDDGVVVVQLEPLDVHGLVEPHAVPLLPNLGQYLRAPLPHRRLQLRRQLLATRPSAVLPRVDAGEEGADPAELAGEPRAQLQRLPAGQRRGADGHVARRRGLRGSRSGRYRRPMLRRRRARNAVGRVWAGPVAPRVRVGGFGHKRDAGFPAAPVVVVVVVVVDLIPAREHGGRHRRRRVRASDLTLISGGGRASLPRAA